MSIGSEDAPDADAAITTAEIRIAEIRMADMAFFMVNAS
jgi:hypothetical protein